MIVLKKYVGMVKLLLCLIISNLLIFTVFNLVATTMFRDKLPNGLLDLNCKYFTISNNSEFIDFSFIEKSNYKFSLMKQPRSNGLLDYQMIYSNISYPIKKGRNFNISDFSNNENIVLVGEDISSSMPSDHVMIEETSYDIIGTLDFENSNTYAYYYTKGNINYVNSSGVFILDGEKTSDINSVFEEIKNNLEINEYKSEQKSFIAILDYSKKLMIILILTLIIYMIYIYFISSIWVNSNKRYLAIQWFLGNYQVVKKISFVYFVFLMFSVVFSYFVSKMIIPYTFPFVLRVTGSCMIVEWLIIIYKLYVLLNHSVNDLTEDK